MEIKTLDGKIVEIKEVGDAVGAAEKYISTQAEIKRLEAALEVKQAEATAYLAEAKKQKVVVEELDDASKKALVIAGVKTPKDFPGDDWLVDYVVGENGV